MAAAKSFAVVTPFQFGWPTFDAVAILTMSLVMVVVMNPDLVRRRLRKQPQQPVHRCLVDRFRHAAAGGRELCAADAASLVAVITQRHPAGGARGGVAELVL
ncbi:hypothetical protein [Janthinobacterium agaricidamnosum]|uniref:hypothetical protein n=1 Tax=Janthinobacterium agaricidamnosum TaxID=55508 RepID=UPI001F563044|nr:hypothetical protein [Janthinobacterium agaricidamnosum]